MRAINIFLFLLMLPIITHSQIVKPQMVGRVMDSDNSEGIEGVEVQLLNTGDIVYTDPEGKFKFKSNKGFNVGEPNYSFNLQKKGYITVSNTNNKVVFSSGAIDNLLMKKDINKHLWITVLDGKTGNFLEHVNINIRGDIKQTNSFGKVNFDLSQFGARKVKASLSKECYKDLITEIDNKGEAYLRLTPICHQKDKLVEGINLSTAMQTLDRAMAARDGSNQGQVKAIETLLQNGHTYNNTNFMGIALENARLTNTSFNSCDFRTCNLKKTTFKGSKVNKANLGFANLRDANFNKCISTSTKYHYVQGSNSTFQNANLTNSSFFLSDLSKVNFSRANLTNAAFAFCDLTNANFENAIVKNTIFFNCILNKASFSNADVENINITGSVSNSVVFSGSQINELKKLSTIHFSNLSIHTKDANAKYPRQYADYRNNKLRQLSNRTHWTIDKWNQKLRGNKEVVGPLDYYSVSEYSTQIKERIVFDNDFWYTGGRASEITNWLDSFIKYIFKETISQSLIVGDITKGKKFIESMARNIKNITGPKEVFLNNDASIVMHKHSGLDPVNRGGITFDRPEDWWTLFSIYRCKNEKKDNYSSSNSYPKIFPKTCKCNSSTPYIHSKYYKKFVEERAKVFKARMLISRESFRIQRSELTRLIKRHNENKTDTLSISPFAILQYDPRLDNAHKVQATNEIRSRFVDKMNTKQAVFSKEDPKQYIQLSAYGEILVKLPINREKYYFTLSDKVKKLLDYKGNEVSYHLDFKFKLNKIKASNDRLVIHAEPIEASITLENEVIWKGNLSVK